MASEEQTNVSSFVFVRHFEEVDEYILARSLPFLICVVAVYLLFVLKLGPDFMKNREPYTLKNAILLHNASQVILSIALVCMAAYPFYKKSIFSKTCLEDDPALRRYIIRGVHFGIFCKISELLDTVFFILKKKTKQVTFLHVYHHSLVVIGTWLLLQYSVNQAIVFSALLNAVVHTIMYSYYFVAALGPQYQKYLTWKKYITTLQMIQFIMMFSFQVFSVTYTTCQHSLFGMVYVLITTAIFFFLFKNFYDKSYEKPKKTVQDTTVTHNGTQEKVKAQ